MNKLTEVTLFDIRDELGSRRDLASILENGSLHFDAFDCGKLPNDMWGGDYEYNLDVDAGWKDTLLLLLIKERFSAIRNFREWAKSHNIPYREGGWW